jgi:adenylate cyclase
MRLEEAITASHSVLAFDPLSPFWQWRLGYWYYYARCWDRATEQCRIALDIDAHYYPAYMTLGNTCIQTGNYDEGIRAIEMMAQIVGRHPLSLGFLGYAYARAGRIDEARKLLQELQKLAPEIYVLPLTYAQIYCGLGEVDQALEWLEKGVSEHEGSIIHFHLEPSFDPLRSHPRYQALLLKMNLEP